ncbi:hypothetical protein TraAM80_09626 [Trypanosoma rangeli]|uniref:Uncharacterized protein n=1 Tax=Trypanosoma rangeli TaxID=5698 RepID=A0A422MUL6_TRYRA|nr:uncharacterized protein TraAM80_09626 [Trypanosoma rangeli]RNE96918.1 hypothetical protein TraAM80_09626 [Trypanosoma rangeli]|eukprot:RNE96918.1 hypothetical protein TraAM80_09626 [Trypanosoma rangeli]
MRFRSASREAPVLPRRVHGVHSPVFSSFSSPFTRKRRVCLPAAKRLLDTHPPGHATPPSLHPAPPCHSGTGLAAPLAARNADCRMSGPRAEQPLGQHPPPPHHAQPTQHAMHPQAIWAFNTPRVPSNTESKRPPQLLRGAEGRAECSQDAPHDHARGPARAPQTAALPMRCPTSTGPPRHVDRRSAQAPRCRGCRVRLRLPNFRSLRSGGP